MGNQPMRNHPTEDQPPGNQPTGDQPTGNQSLENQPTRDQSTGNQPTRDQSQEGPSPLPTDSPRPSLHPGVPTGGGLHPFCSAEHDDGRGRLLLGRWARQGHVHQALPQRAQQVGRACRVQVCWGPGPAEPALGCDTFPVPSQAPLDVQCDLLPPQLRGHGPAVHSRQRRPQTGEAGLLSPGAGGHGAQLAHSCFPLSCRCEKWWKSSRGSLF